MLERLDPELEDYNPPERVSALVQDADRLGTAIYERSGDTRIPHFVPSSGPMVYRLLCALRDTSIVLPGMRFCEWGSGLGLVTMLANRLGFDACGIEIEPELVSEAKHLAASHGIDVDFYCASMFPQDNLDAGNESGCQYSDLDVVFVYPWPREIDTPTDLFNEHCKIGAVLVLYHGEVLYDVFRKTA